MKKYMLIAAVFLLTGCPGPGDRMVDRESTTAVIRDDNVCIVSLLNPGEKITAIQVNSDKRSYLNKTFDNSPVYVAKGECLPLFDFTFTPGEKYSIAYDVKSNEAEYHLVTADVAIESDPSGKIKIH